MNCKRVAAAGVIATVLAAGASACPAYADTGTAAQPLDIAPLSTTVQIAGVSCTLTQAVAEASVAASAKAGSLDEIATTT